MSLEGKTEEEIKSLEGALLAEVENQGGAAGNVSLLRSLSGMTICIGVFVIDWSKLVNSNSVEAEVAASAGFSQMIRRLQLAFAGNSIYSDR